MQLELYPLFRVLSNYPDKQKSHFMWLGKPGSDLLPQLRKVVDEEVAVLRTGNIPAYYTRADSRLLYNGSDHQVDVPIVQSGYEVILETCRDHLSEQDLKKQCLLIKQSYLNHSMNESK